MTAQEAKQLRPNDRVEIWPGTEHACSGRVITRFRNEISFQWDDGDPSIIHINDMQDVRRI